MLNRSLSKYIKLIRNICWLQLLKCKYLLLFYVIYESKMSLFFKIHVFIYLDFTNVLNSDIKTMTMLTYGETGFLGPKCVM